MKTADGIKAVDQPAFEGRDYLGSGARAQCNPQVPNAWKRGAEKLQQGDRTVLEMGGGRHKPRDVSGLQKLQKPRDQTLPWGPGSAAPWMP